MIEKQIPSTTIIELIKEESNLFHGLTLEVGKTIVGQADIVQAILIAILCDGHILLEGVPGVAKTTMVKAVAKALGLDFKRIQFTPDLLPSDLIGSLIFNQKTHEFETRKGPIFANLILADEINRAPSKVQAALLEGMQERQVTIGSTTYPLDNPFLVFATQNPIEQEGTYRLPEAQLDRFLFKLSVRYPAIQEEKEIVKRSSNPIPLSTMVYKEDIKRAHGLVHSVYCDDKVLDYIVNIVFATRAPANYKLAELTEYIEYGVSPRATLALYNASKAHAFLKGRHFVTPDDVKAVALWVLGHRIPLTYHAEAAHVTTDMIIKKIINTVPTP
ncbi:MoxR family ATPase [Candidatus Dependentiae bacterium]|nr:MAG: MoxR family ATPase [Candidatus Dependentiae bacterium]